MAYLLIVVRTDDTIIDRAAFSKDLSLVNFDASEIGLAFRHDPCKNSSQYFVIHSVLKAHDSLRNQSTVEEDRGTSQRSRINPRTMPSKSQTSHRKYSNRKTSLSEYETNPACTCNNDGQCDGPCTVCDKRLVPEFSFVLLDVKYEIVTKLNSDIAYISFRELVRSKGFRERFVSFIRRKHKLKDVSGKVCRCENVYRACSLSISLPRLLEIHLEPACMRFSYSWNNKIGVLVHKRMVLEETMAWLSTLGGGYSSLGDYFAHFSEEAGRISVSQLQIAMEMGDPVMAAKCRLFFALSLMQRGHLQKTKTFIREQYNFATHLKVHDQRLIDMCKGMWSRLQYIHAQKRREKLAITAPNAQKLSTTSGKGSTY